MWVLQVAGGTARRDLGMLPLPAACPSSAAIVCTKGNASKPNASRRDFLAPGEGFEAKPAPPAL